MEIRAEEISQIIRGQIKDYQKKVEMSETGIVLSVGDGVARVYGVENAMAMEMLEFPGGIYGLCLNLEEDNVGVAIMGDDTKIKEGDTVKRTGTNRGDPCGGSGAGPGHRCSGELPSTAKARSMRRSIEGLKWWRRASSPVNR